VVENKMDKLIWTKISDPERSAIEESSSINGIHYEILFNQRYVDQKFNGYTLYQINDIMGAHEDGYVDEKGIICGCATACAIGLPPSAIKKTIDEIKELANQLRRDR
jgi:hypothetical protein